MNLLDQYFLNRYFTFLKITKKSEVWLLDIDNTLADTWTQLQHKSRINPINFYQKLPVLQGSKKFFDENIANKPYYFISVRNKGLHFITTSWLNNNGLRCHKNISLLSEVNIKLNYIKMAKEAGYTVHLLDDLSYGHEHGEVKYHDSLIEAIKKIECEYYDYNFIQKLNNT